MARLTGNMVHFNSSGENIGTTSTAILQLFDGSDDFVDSRSISLPLPILAICGILEWSRPPVNV